MVTRAQLCCLLDVKAVQSRQWTLMFQRNMTSPSLCLNWAVYVHILLTQTLKTKGKAVPLQAWSGPEGSRKLRFPDFMTTVQNGGKVVSLMHRSPLPTGNTPGTPFC
jgi:hypothetical protein